MPVNIFGEPIWRDVVTAPAPTDDLTAASVADGISQLADRDRFLLETVALGGWWKQTMAPLSNASNRFNLDEISKWLQIDVTDAGSLVFPVRLPPIGQLMAMRVLRTGGLGPGHSLLPALPNYQLGVSNALDVTDALLVDSPDPANNLTEYETLTSIEFDLDALGTVWPIAQHDFFYIQVEGESGGNAIASTFAVYSIEILVDPIT
jgi:hypothetical protein